MKFKVPIKRFNTDGCITSQERYEKLLKHHEEETTILIRHIEELESRLDKLDKLSVLMGSDTVLEKDE